MSDNKKYYYLKLKEDFFDSDAMIVMESMPDGYKYSNILLKLYLRSLKHEGKLMFNDRIPYNSTILSQVTRHSVGDVERAIKVFEEMNLIEILDNGAIFISDIQNFVGRSSTEGDRKREYRRRIEEEREQLKLTGQTSGQMSDKRPPEIDIELEKEKELETDNKDHSPAKAERIPYKEIIDYLNEQTGRRYSHKAAKNQDLIKARWNEGFRVDDFKQVIDTKVKDWSNDSKMNQYLRPVTLFSNKFDDYLNQVPVNGGDDGGESYGGIEF